MDVTTDQPTLFADLPQPDGPVWRAALRSVHAAVAAGRLDADSDALAIAHLSSLCRSMDRHAARGMDPRALSVLSRELRAVAAGLGLSRTDAAPAAGKADPFGFLDVPAEDLTT